MSSRRPKVGRRITTTAESSEDESSSPTVIKALPKSRSKSKSHVSKITFPSVLPGDTSAADDENSEPVFVPRKSALSRKAIERNAAKRAMPIVARGVEQLDLGGRTPGGGGVRYDKEYLEELKRGQQNNDDGRKEDVGPTVEEAMADGAVVVVDEDVEMMPAPPPPMDEGEKEESEDADMELDLARPKDEILVPDEGIVRVMKQRRKERAERALREGKADDFISLDAMDSDQERGDDGVSRQQLLLRPKKKKESRLARDDMAEDEDLADYIEADDKIMYSGSKRERREADRRRKQTIKEALENAAEDDSDVSGDSLRDDFERSQVRAGAFGSAEHAQRGFEAEMEQLAKNPPVVMALPDIGDVVKRLEGALKALEIRKVQTMRQVEMLQAEKGEIAEREKMIQGKLDEFGKMVGKEAGEEKEREVKQDRGLESFGSTPI